MKKYWLMMMIIILGGLLLQSCTEVSRNNRHHNNTLSYDRSRNGKKQAPKQNLEHHGHIIHYGVLEHEHTK